jgi:hypothetical protein
MARDIVQLPSDGSGKKLDAFSYDLSDGRGTVYEHPFVLCDSSGAIVDVLTSTPAGTERGLAVRQVGAVALDATTLAALESITVVDGGGSLTVDGPVTDTQIRATPLPVSGTVTANAGTGPFPVSDNGGSMTVDAPVATPVFVRLSDGAAAITALPITDNGGSVTVDGSVTLGAGAVNIGDVDVLTLPALPAGSNNIGDVDVLTLPALPAGSNNIGDVDVLTLPALVAGTAEIGKVQISDGTDVATVLPVRTQPGTSEKAITTIEMPSRLPSYMVVTGEIAAAITIGVKELCTFFHPSGVTQDVYITEIWLSTLVTTAATGTGRSVARVTKTAAVGTGGTNLSVADIGGAGGSVVAANAAANIMQAKTGGASDGTVFLRRPWEYATQALGRISEPLFQVSDPADGIILRGGVADGINVSLERVAAHTALVDQTTVSIRWVEL